MKCFYSLIDDLFLAFFGSMEVWRNLSVYCGFTEAKRLVGPEGMPIAKREKMNEESALAGLGGRKSRARPEKAEKNRVWEIDFHESDPNRRKTNLHNAKKYAIAGLREKKSRVRPAPLLCRQGRPQKYLKNRFVGIEKSRQKVCRQDK